MFFAFAIAGFTLLLVLIFSRVAQIGGLLDYPNSTTKQHEIPTPVIGGIVIVCILLTVLIASDRPPKLDLLLFGTACLGLLGFLDDVIDLPVWIRLSCQFGVGLGMALGTNVLVERLGPIASFDLVLPGGMQVLLTVVFVVFVINAVNMSDGIDGNAAGLVLIGLGLIALGQLLTVNELRKPDWLSALIVSVAVFWTINVSLIPVRKIFLGDAGTLPLGFILSWLCVDFSQGPGRSIHPVMVGWVLLIPTADFLAVITIRVISGRSPISGDRMHIHHMLSEIFDQNDRRALAVILSSAACFGCLGIYLTAWDPAYGLLGVICAIMLLVSGQVRYGIFRRESRNVSD